MKCCFRVYYVLAAYFAVIATAALMASNSEAQETANRSETVTITDADEEFFGAVDDLRASFERISAASPAFVEAEEIAERLAKDPLNDRLKKEMIRARSLVLGEKLGLLRDVAKNEDHLDSVYDSLKKQLDAQLAESKAAIDRQQTAEAGEAQFLTEALTELIQLDQLLPRTETTSVADVSEAIQLTADQREQIRKFKRQLHSAELEMKLAQQSVDLQQRQLALLGLARIKATEDYLDLKMAIASSKADQAIFAAIARNDLVSLEVIAQQERLNSMLSRPPIQYRSPATDGVLGEGFQFADLPSQGTSVLEELGNNQKTINRVQKALGSRQSQSRKTGTYTSNASITSERKK